LANLEKAFDQHVSFSVSQETRFVSHETAPSDETDPERALGGCRTSVVRKAPRFTVELIAFAICAGDRRLLPLRQPIARRVIAFGETAVLKIGEPLAG